MVNIDTSPTWAWHSFSTRFDHFPPESSRLFQLVAPSVLLGSLPRQTHMLLLPYCSLASSACFPRPPAPPLELEEPLRHRRELHQPCRNHTLWISLLAIRAWGHFLLTPVSHPALDRPSTQQRKAGKRKGKKAKLGRDASTIQAFQICAFSSTRRGYSRFLLQ